MTTVGVRETRNNPSKILQHVEPGATFETTNHGRAVAVLGPDRDPVRRNWDEAAGVWSGFVDPTPMADLEDHMATELNNPWED